MPDLNELDDLKGMTRLAMPVIKGRKRYQINNQSLTLHGHDHDHGDYAHHCDKCQHPFFDRADVERHQQYADCVDRPYLCPFCERPFKSVLSVKKHCVNLHSSIINWDLVGELLEFVDAQQRVQDAQELNYAKLVRMFARKFFLRQEVQNKKPVKIKKNNS